jgi:hypothetical protein
MKNTWMTSVGTLDVVTDRMVVVVPGSVVVVVVVGGIVSRSAAGKSSSGTGTKELESEIPQATNSAEVSRPTTARERTERLIGLTLRGAR